MSSRCLAVALCWLTSAWAAACADGQVIVDINLRFYGLPANYMLDQTAIGFLSDHQLAVNLQVIVGHPCGANCTSMESESATTLIYDIDQRRLLQRAALGNDTRGAKTFAVIGDGSFIVREPSEVDLFSSELKRVHSFTDHPARFGSPIQVSPNGNYLFIPQATSTLRFPRKAVVLGANDFQVIRDNVAMKSKLGDRVLLEERVDGFYIVPFEGQTKLFSRLDKECGSFARFLSTNTLLMTGCGGPEVKKLDGTVLYHPHFQDNGTGNSVLATSKSGFSFARASTWCSTLSQVRSLGIECKPNRSQLDVFETDNGKTLFSYSWNSGTYLDEGKIALAPSGNWVALLSEGRLRVWKIATGSR